MSNLNLILFSFSLLFFSTSLQGNSSSCHKSDFLKKIDNIKTESLDSRLDEVDMHIREFVNLRDTTCLIELYKSYAYLSGGEGNYYLVFNTLWKALVLAEHAQLKKEQFRLHLDIARFYGYLNRFDKAKEHFLNASKLKHQLSQTNQLSNLMAIDYYFMHLTMYKIQGDWDSASNYLDSCYLNVDTTNISDKYYYLELERGIQLAQHQQYKEALVLYNYALDSIKMINPKYQGIIHKHIGDAYYNLSQYNKSLMAYQNAAQSLNLHKSHTDYLPDVYGQLAVINFELKNFKEAFRWQEKESQLNFQLFDSRSELNSFLMNVQDDFRNYKEEEQKRFRKQELIQLEQKQQLLLFQLILLLGCLIFIVLIAFTYSRLQNEKISVEKALNHQLQQQNEEKEGFLKRIEKKNEELITFSNIMSHDLKAPLRTISAFSGLIQKQLEKDFKIDDVLLHLGFINSSAESMSILIEDLLMFSKINLEESEFSTVKLNDIILLVLPAFSFDINSGKAVVNIGELPSISGNKSLLKTVFHNLISNAIKYQPKDKAKHQAKVDIWSVEAPDEYHIFIQDNGIGIPTDYVDRLFKPFVRFHATSEYKGTGLGMSICERIMSNHKGQVHLAKTSPSGSVFKLIFPKDENTEKPVSSMATSLKLVVKDISN